MTTDVTGPQQVSITCPGCLSQQQVPADAERIICQSCGKPVVFRHCDTTGKTVPVLPEWGSWTHPGCAIQHGGFTCPACHSQQPQPADAATQTVCQSCGKPVVFRHCDTTGKTVPVAAEWGYWTHPGCAVQHFACPACHSQLTQPADAATPTVCQSCGKPVVLRHCDTTGNTVPVPAEWTSWTHPGCATTHVVAHPALVGFAENQNVKQEARKKEREAEQDERKTTLYVPKPRIGSPAPGQSYKTCGRCGYKFMPGDPGFTIVDLARCRSCGALWGALTVPQTGGTTPDTFRVTCAHCGNQNPGGGIPWVKFYLWTDFRPTRRWDGTRGPAVPVDAVCPRCKRSIFRAYPSQVLDCPGCGKPFPVETIISYTGKNRRRGAHGPEHWQWESVPQRRMVNSGPLSYRCPDCKTKVPHGHAHPRPAVEATLRSYV